jgi:hypothetical protein
MQAYEDDAEKEERKLDTVASEAPCDDTKYKVKQLVSVPAFVFV